ncbi:MAG: hypothetical protein WA268_05835 [Xanthobacteraceae bacterium]
MSEHQKPPKELDAIADVVLGYRPKPKSKPGKKRKHKAAKLARAVAGHNVPSFDHKAHGK